MEDMANVTDSECLKKKNNKQIEMPVGSMVSPGLVTDEKGPRDFKVES